MWHLGQHVPQVRLPLLELCLTLLLRYKYATFRSEERGLIYHMQLKSVVMAVVQTVGIRWLYIASCVIDLPYAVDVSSRGSCTDSRH